MVKEVSAWSLLLGYGRWNPAEMRTREIEKQRHALGSMTVRPQSPLCSLTLEFFSHPHHVSPPPVCKSPRGNLGLFL